MVNLIGAPIYRVQLILTAMLVFSTALVLGTLGADPSCCLDLHEKQWTLSVHQASGNGKNLTDLHVNGMGMYSGGNCVSELSAVDTQCGNNDDGGRYIASERLLGVKDYDRTFRVVTVVEDGTPVVQCSSTPGVSCDDAGAVDLFFFSEISPNFCFTKFERNISFAGITMHLYSFQGGAALVNTAADCTVAGFMGPSWQDRPSQLSPISSYYDFGPAEPTQRSFHVPSVCFKADGSFV